MKKSRPAKFGWETPDSQPVFLATGLKKPPTLEETIARVLRSQQAIKMAGRLDIDETAEDAEDFDIPDDPIDTLTRFEHAADAVPLGEMKARLRKALIAKPSLGAFLRRSFGHLFGAKDLDDPVPPPAPVPDPKQIPLPEVPPPAK